MERWRGSAIHPMDVDPANFSVYLTPLTFLLRVFCASGTQVHSGTFGRPPPPFFLSLFCIRQFTHFCPWAAPYIPPSFAPPFVGVWVGQRRDSLSGIRGLRVALPAGGSVLPTCSGEGARNPVIVTGCDAALACDAYAAISFSAILDLLA